MNEDRSKTESCTRTKYTYDGDGNRIEKSSGVIFWYGAGTEILDESNFSGTFTSEYVFFGGKRIARRDVSSGNIYYYEEDMLGSSRTVVQAGQTSPCYDSDFRPFGSELSITNSCLQEYKFEGKERDTETGNDDFGARYYRSNLGRWLSADWSSVPAPVPYANLANPQTLNLYAMVSDNPETFADLVGHIEWAPFRLVESVIASGGVADILEMMEGMAGPSGYATGLTYEGTLNSEAAQQQGQSTAPTTPTAQSSVTTTESAQNRQPDGSYKATPAQLAKIKEAADKKTTIGNGECVTACERFTGVLGPTSSWRGGKPASELTDKDKGTAIATFIKGSDGQWHYLPDSGGHKNSGTFMGTSTKGTFWMADQWPAQKPVTIWNVGSNPNNASMNAASYRVIIVPNP